MQASFTSRSGCPTIDPDQENHHVPETKKVTWREEENSPSHLQETIERRPEISLPAGPDDDGPVHGFPARARTETA
jgi:hypothetical protein